MKRKAGKKLVDGKPLPPPKVGGSPATTSNGKGKGGKIKVRPSKRASWYEPESF